MKILTVSAITLAALAGCASTPTPNEALTDARSRVATAQRDTSVTKLAPDELARATEALRVAEKAQTDHAKKGNIDHLSYLTVQRVAIAQETASSRSSQAITAGAAAERDRMRLAMRTAEADSANRQLAVSEASNAQKASALATADATNAQQANALAAADANAAASAMREQAIKDSNAAREASMQSQLDELNAKKTERGMVVTLGDVLFDTGRATVRHGASNNMAKLAAFFQRNPDRRASIEGYTDDVGSDATNLNLSERRATAVMSELVSLGVPSDRLTMRAHGKAMPVADNATAAGRQMNRRVEIVFAPTSADVASR